MRLSPIPIGHSMHNLATEIIALWVLVGTIPAARIGLRARGTKGWTGWAVIFALPIAALLISIAVIPIALISHEVCEKWLGLCMPTTHQNIFTFAIYPLLGAPVYWLIMLAFKAEID